MKKDKIYLFISIALIIAGIISIISGVCKDMIIKELKIKIKAQSELIDSQRSIINQLDSINDFLNTHKVTRYTIIEKDTITN
ncbi:hypothetical protein [Dysgonomonas massiliensis]|uniref:hypothetical protein n=1 Tax=Dysgonomonas massiliensis TaxID=2040292 RepID=UPI000C773286|nr:hypothetical protein [Dysgonomonas massiliensis]